MFIQKPRIIAFYLPQFHPIPENDKWWGKGFTEWTNVGRAKPLFPGHYQPRVPADLGYYDLRLEEVRVEQAKLAQEAGIEGFCYWHYWFGKNKELIERPFKEVVLSGKPDYPFCLAWANESWYSKLWDKNGTKTLLQEQKYGGEDDYKAHFYSVLSAFKDKRYMKVNGKPIFMIYQPMHNPELSHFINIWNDLAKKEGLKGIYWIAQCVNMENDLSSPIYNNYDAINVVLGAGWYINNRGFVTKLFSFILRKLFNLPYIYDYRKVAKNPINSALLNNKKISFSILTGWDHTPRSGKNGTVLTNYTPENFRRCLKNFFHIIKNNKTENNNLVFLKSWNEWGEGNYLEPDLKYGKAFLKNLEDVLRNNEK